MTCCRGAPAVPNAASPAWWPLITAAFIAGNSMVWTLAVNLSELTATELRAAHVALSLTCAAVFGLVGIRLLRDTVAALRRRIFATECLFVTGVSGAFAVSCFSLFKNQGPVYFEVVSLLLVIYAWGQQLKAVMQSGVQKQLMQAVPANETAWVRASAEAPRERLLVSDTRPGMLVEVQADQVIPVDGIIVSGTSFVNESALTGEGACVSRGVGERVVAGMSLIDGALLIETTTSGTGRSIDAILENVRQGLVGKSRIETQASRLGRYFFPAVTLAATATFIFWWAARGAEVGFVNAMSVLLVACPCAVGFATPTAMWASVIALARLGFVTKNSSAVESLAKTTVVVFDKTGTLTEVAPDAVAWAYAPISAHPPEFIRGLVRAAERVSHHPLAMAFRNIDLAASTQNFRPLQAEILPGRGIVVCVSTPLQKYQVEVGDAHKLISPDASLAFRALLEKLPGHARPLAILVDNKLEALVGLEDVALSFAQSLVESLQTTKRQVHLFSGDTPARVQRFVADNVVADMRPSEKRDAITSLKAAGETVCFVGDGLNDAAAIAESQVGIAITTGASLARATGDFLVTQQNLKALPQAIAITERTMEIITSNLKLAAAYNVVAMLVAASGYLHPVFAAFVMLLSSLSVTLRSARLVQGTAPVTS